MKWVLATGHDKATAVLLFCQASTESPMKSRKRWVATPRASAFRALERPAVRDCNDGHQQQPRVPECPRAADVRPHPRVVQWLIDQVGQQRPHDERGNRQPVVDERREAATNAHVTKDEHSLTIMLCRPDGHQRPGSRGSPAGRHTKPPSSAQPGGLRTGTISARAGRCRARPAHS